MDKFFRIAMIDSDNIPHMRTAIGAQDSGTAARPFVYARQQTRRKGKDRSFMESTVVF